MKKSDHFDLIVSGVGFVQRFRKITPDQGEPYYGVTIACLRGKPNGEGKVAKTYIDCNVVGDALSMAKRVEPLFEGGQEPKVMIGFTLGDLEQRSFIYKRGEKRGQTGYSLKGRLFQIKWFKANGGETVYSETELNSVEEQPELPSEVKLVKDDPYYDEREQQLISQGYSYVGGGLWSLAGAAKPQ